MRSLILFLLLTTPLHAQFSGSGQCSKTPGFHKLDKAELDGLLAAHPEWWNEAQVPLAKKDHPTVRKLRKDPRRADLCRVNMHSQNLGPLKLPGANLHGIYLLDAALEQSDLRYAELSRSVLSQAVLSQSNLGWALMRSAIMKNTVATSAILRDADLSFADLENADLANSNLSRASLRGAKIKGTNLTKASFRDADLTGAFFQPARGQLPILDEIAQAKGLSTLRYDQPRALVELRQLFKEAGYRGQEREVTRALKHGEVMRRLKWDDDDVSLGYVVDVLDGLFNFVLFEFTTEWGMKPARPLVIILVLIVLFTPIYRKALSSPDADGIWIVWSDDRRRRDLGNDSPCSSGNDPFEAPTDRPLMLTGSNAWKVAAYFSLLSAFHIGWKDLNVGSWIARIQRYEFTYRATGWARTASGCQSLVSVYLLAISFLTYFGRPFE